MFVRSEINLENTETVAAQANALSKLVGVCAWAAISL